MAVKHTTLPRWATNDVVDPTSLLNNVIEPAEGKKDIGWNYVEKPARQYFNWMARQTNQWLEYIDESLNLFAPHETNPPTMAVELNPGHLNQGTDVDAIAGQTTAAIPAPITDPRIDRIVINEITGAVSIVSGVEAVSPVAPAFDRNSIPICQVLVTVGMTEITNADITDERSVKPFIDNVVDDFYLIKPDSTAISAFFQNVTTGTTAADGFRVGINDDEHALLWNYENTEMRFAVNNLLRGKIDAGGNWLISPSGGDGTPARDLVIYNSGANQDCHLQFVNDTTGMASGSIGFIVGITTGEIAQLWNYSNTEMQFATNNVLRGKIATNGQWLISPEGTDVNPLNQLHIYSQTASTTGIRMQHSGTGITSGDGSLVYVDASKHFHIRNYESNDIWFETTATFRGKIAAGGNWLISPDGSDITPANELVVYESGVNGTPGIQMVNGATGLGAADGFLLALDSTENALIYNGSVTDTKFFTGDTFRGKISSGGNWLISPDGSDITPQRTLVLYESGAANDAYIQFLNDATGISAGNGFIVGVANDEDAQIRNQHNSDLDFYTNATFRGKIAASGSWLISPDGTDITPSRDLVLYKSGSGATYTQWCNSTTGTDSTDGFRIGITSGETAELWNYESTDMNFAVNNLQEMYLDASNRGLVVGTPTGAGKGVGTVNAQSGFYENGVKLAAVPAQYTTTGTTASIASGAEVSVVITHGLGTDNVIVDLIAKGDVSGGKFNWAAAIRTFSEYNKIVLGHHSQGGGAVTFPVTTAPAAGQVVIRFRNIYVLSQTISYIVIVRQP